MHTYLHRYVVDLHVCLSLDIPKNRNDYVKQFLQARKCVIK